MRFAEFNIGDAFKTNPVIADKNDMLSYAEKYDPQYFHLDEEAATKSPYGSIIASGFYTITVVWAEFVRMNVLGEDCLGGLGMDNIRWKLPVKPNDRLIGEYQILGKKMLSDGKRGILEVGIRIQNQDNDEVVTLQTKILVKA